MGSLADPPPWAPPGGERASWGWLCRSSGLTGQLHEASCGWEDASSAGWTPGTEAHGEPTAFLSSGEQDMGQHPAPLSARAQRGDLGGLPGQIR